MTAEQRGQRAPAVVERFIKQLNITFKAVKLYPLTSSIPMDSARTALEVLHEIMRTDPEVKFEVAKDGLIYQGQVVYGGHEAFVNFALEFYNRGLTEIRFHPGVTEDEIARFLSLLDIPPNELAGSGGVAGHLWELQVTNISVQETATRIVDAVPMEEDEPWPPDAAMVDEVLNQSLGRRPRGQRLLVRLAQDAGALQTFLISTPDDLAGVNAATVARRVSAMARAARAESPVDREQLYKRLARSLDGLDASVVRRAIADLLEEARHVEPVGNVLREMGVERLARDLVAELSFDDAGRADIARTLRNLVTFGIAPRTEATGVVAEALREEGASEEFVESVIEAALPARLLVRERPKVSAKPAETVLRLLDIAADQVAVDAAPDPDLEELAAEAAVSISDGDVLGALATLVAVEDRPERFDGILEMLQDNLAMLVSTGDLEVAADAAESLVVAAQRTDITLEQREAIRKALTGLAGVDAMRSAAAVMRLNGPGSSEYDSCNRLLGVLGEYPVSSMLEILADETDMTARKALVDLLSGMASDYIHVFGERVGDPRWYFVRNIVSILGATRSPDALAYLERTLRHSDPRVRRETVRALAGIRLAFADEMLIAALDDDDAANAQFAARNLGSLRLRPAVPALERAARGEGRGNRDMQTRIEAIEALGRIGAKESEPVLREISRQRGLRASRTRELRAAAERALLTLQRVSAGGGRHA